MTAAAAVTLGARRRGLPQHRGQPAFPPKRCPLDPTIAPAIGPRPRPPPGRHPARRRSATPPAVGPPPARDAPSPRLAVLSNRPPRPVS
jgi:hypothetical protein